MKKICVMVLFAVLMLQAPAFAQEMRVAVLNTAYIYAKSLAGKSGEAQVQQKTAKLRQEMERTKKDFKRLVEDYKKQRSALSVENRRLKEIEIKRKQTELKELAIAIRQGDQAARQELLPPINRFLQENASKFLEGKDYTLVLDATRGGLAYWDQGFDVSEAVLKYCDEKWKAKGN